MLLTNVHLHAMSENYPRKTHLEDIEISDFHDHIDLLNSIGNIMSTILMLSFVLHQITHFISFLVQ